MILDFAIPDQALGYSYNRGGINNQKIALLGLFLAAVTEGPRRVVLPDIVIFDQITFVHKRVPIATAFDVARLRDFAESVGVAILDRPPAGDEGGWDYFHAGERHIAGAAASGTLDGDSLVARFFRALVPRARTSPDVSRLRDIAFGRRSITHVIQMRIERDWDFHVQSRVDPDAGDNEDNRHTAESIARKFRATHPAAGSTIYVVCDEAALVEGKDEIRRSLRERHDIEAVWKSDLLPDLRPDDATLLDLSLMDFEIALASEFFVGTSRSTFSGMAALERFAQSGAVDNHSIYNALGPTLATRHDRGAFRSARLASARDIRDPACGYELGQILEAAGDLRQAHDRYDARGAFGGPDREEVYLALYGAARLKAALGDAPDAVLAAFARAADVSASRAEALHGGARHARLHGRYDDAYAFAARGVAIARPAAGRAVEAWIYDWALIDEFAVATSWTGRPVETLQACIRLLTEAKLPAEHRDRIVANAKFAIDRIAGL
ncbi:O-fucosyltransferase family protein [Methylobacterium indicum]|uniref:O-fucosyltransferase family protein n=1 Tax=Methylobacterium indicum TaxID=1775910 RepID=UPI001A938A1D|nr:O-fucosyltransferase family protein [Methylobacterium indicum]